MSEAELLSFWRIGVALVFAASAAGKATSFRHFAVAVSSFELLPSRWARPAAAAALGGEIAVVALLAAGGPMLAAGFALAAALLLAFSVAIAGALRRRLAISCNCFGPGDRRLSAYDLVRNGVVLGGCGWGLWLAGAEQGLDGGVLLLVALMSAVFVVVVLNLRDIVETLRRPL